MKMAIVALLAVGMALVIGAGPVLAGDLKVEGVLAAKSASSVTIRTQQNQSITLTVTSATRIERNGRRVGLAALQIGDRAQARYDGTTLVASKVETVGP